MDFDVLIIGAGAGGAMTALRLCEQGLKVGLVERGPKFNPQKDYVQNYPDWETRKDPLESARFPEHTIDVSHRTEYTLNNRTRRRNPFVYHRVHGVGGSTLHYQGEAHRFPEHAFNQFSKFGWGLDWPINYQDLEPYYEQTEQLLGVAGDPKNPHKVKRGSYPTPAHPLSVRSQWLAEAATKAGMTLLPNPLALPSKSLDGRLPCQHSGGCNFGCVFGAKSSVDQAIIPRAEKTGNLTLITEHRVHRLLSSKKGTISGLQISSKDNSKQTLTAKKYVLAAGAIETPRLMLASDLPNPHDQIGRYFMETITVWHFFSAPIDFRVHRGPPLDSRIWDFCYPQDTDTGGFVLGSAGYLYPRTGPVGHARRQNGFGRAHKQKVRETFAKEVYLFGIGEQEPRADNRVLLSQHKDPKGERKVKIQSVYSKRDINTIKQIGERLNQWQQQIPNSKYDGQQSSLTRPSSTHVGGTCRMGQDPSNSVVDAFGKVHAIDNCYVTDASVLNTQGAGDSPSLTIQALALRTADSIASAFKEE